MTFDRRKFDKFFISQLNYFFIKLFWLFLEGTKSLFMQEEKVGNCDENIWIESFLYWILFAVIHQHIHMRLIWQVLSPNIYHGRVQIETGFCQVLHRISYTTHESFYVLMNCSFMTYVKKIEFSTPPLPLVTKTFILYWGVSKS